MRSCRLPRDSSPRPRFFPIWTQVSISFAVCGSTVCRRVVTAAAFPLSATFIVPCVNSAVFSGSLSITVKKQMCGLPLVLVNGPLRIRERLVVAACIIPFVISLLLRRIKVQHIAASTSLRRDSSCTCGSRWCVLCFGSACFLGDHLQKMFKLEVPPQT